MKQPFTKDINQPVQQYPVQRWRGGELMQATDL